MNKLQRKTDDVRIDEQQFAYLLEAYGGDLKRWPQEYQVAALQLLQHSESAQRLRQAALALDKLLDTVPVPPPSPWLRQRILATARQTATTTQDIWQRFLQWVIGTTPTEYLWRPAVTFLLPLGLGILIGFYSTQAIDTNADSQSASVDVDQEVSLLDLDNEDFFE